MRRFPVSWSDTLAKLGFRRRFKRPSHRKEFRCRRPQFEALEERAMLTAIPVNSLLDNTTAGDGLTTLREAIITANANSDADTIQFDSSLTASGPVTITLSQGQHLTIANNVTIVGPGADKLSISGNDQTRVFYVNSGVTAAINGLAITHGNAGTNRGGGIYSMGNLSLSGDLVQNNWAYGAGGIYQTEGSITVTNSTIDNNHSTGSGDATGGLMVGESTASIVGSTISNNTAYVAAGLFLWNSNGTIANSTFSTNTASLGYGAGIYVNCNKPYLTATLTNVTVANNNAGSGPGGGVHNYNDAFSLAIYNTIVAGNYNNSGASDVAGTFSSTSSYNLIGAIDGSVGLVNGTATQSGTKALPQLAGLMALDNYGGPTKTHALSPTSPAVDRGSSAKAALAGLTMDQRGFRRDIDYGVAGPTATTVDIGAVELPILMPPGDFNGDGRSDDMAFDPSTGALYSTTWQNDAGPEPGEWGRLDITGSPQWSDFKVGDFNGDGRDDVVARKTVGSTKTFAFAISEGNRFQILTAADPSFNSYSLPWTELFVGDFDGDKSDDLLGWNPTNSAWEALHYHERTGFTLDSGSTADWGNALRGNNIPTPITVGDVNRDGRDDLVARASTATNSAWWVALSQPNVGGRSQFTQANFDGWFNSATTDIAQLLVDVNKSYDSFLNIFSKVYNNVELEIYPGLMKGIDATEQTARGNDWDQAALLVKRLEDDGFQADIASGQVLATQESAQQWIGTLPTAPTSAVGKVIRSALDSNAVYDDDVHIVQFKHAWVRALVPTADGLEWKDVDPSWKYKDRQPGVTLDPAYQSFAEFGYLARSDNELPVEAFEDQAMSYLATQNKSLAEVPYDGPIVQKQFAQIPIGLATGVAIYDPIPNDASDGVTTYGNLAEIVNSEDLKARLTHRATVDVSRERSDVQFAPTTIDIADLTVGSSQVHWWTGIDITSHFQIEKPAPSGQPAIRLNGRNYVVVPIPNGYDVTPNTRVKLDFDYDDTDGTPDSSLKVDIGLDSNGMWAASPLEGEQFFTLASYFDGSVHALQTSGGSGSLATKYLANSSNPVRANWLVLGLDQTNNHQLATTNIGRFSNIVIYEESGSDVQQSGLANGATSERVLIAPYTVTKNTVLDFEFKASSPAGSLHAIAWDDNNSTTDDSGRRFKVAGTGSLPSGYTNVSPSSTGTTSDGYQQFSVSIGVNAGLTGVASATMDRLRFFTTGSSATSNFRKFALHETPDVGGTNVYFPQIVVPVHSLEPINLGFTKQEYGAGTADDVYNYQLSINGALQPGIASFHTGDNVKLRITHLGPTDLYTNNPVPNTYTRAVGKDIAIGFDADQYSSQHIVELEAGLNGLMANGAQVEDIGSFLSYAGTKYWYEYNRSNRIIDGLMQTVGAKQWVGSGIMAADAVLIPASDQPNTHLDFPIVPKNMGVDLPNTNHASLDLQAGQLDDEAFQLTGYNGSALESATVEETIDSRSVSTIRGLQDAFNSATIDNWVWVFDSVWANGQRTIYRRGAIGDQASHSGTVYSSTGTTPFNANDLNGHSSSVKDSVVAILNNQDEKYGGSDTHGSIRVLIPQKRSVVDYWSGSVYVAEFKTNTDAMTGSYIIAQDGGTPTSGGFSGGQISLPNPNLRLGPIPQTNQSGDPVQPANGNMSREDTDFAFPNVGIPLDFKRQYNSESKLNVNLPQQPQIDVGLGPGWTHSFSDRLYYASTGTNGVNPDVIWVTSTGEQHLFTYSSANGGYTSPHELFGSLKVVSGGYKYLDPDGTEYDFESTTIDTVAIGNRAARLTKKLDRDGNGVGISYPSGVNTATAYQIGTVYDVNITSRGLVIAYANGQISAVNRYVDGTPQSIAVGAWNYGYQLIGGKNYLTTAMSPPPTADTTALITTYKYFGQDAGDTVPSAVVGLMKQVTEPNLDYHKYEYYANGRVFRVTASVDLKNTSDTSDDVTTSQSYNYNLYRNLAQVTDERGNVETDIYQLDGLLKREIHPDRSRLDYGWGGGADEFLMTSSTDEVGATETFNYYETTDETAYHRPGELKQLTDTNGNTTSYIYGNYRGTSATPYISDVTQVTVDPVTSGLASVVTLYSRDPVTGHLLSQTNANGAPEAQTTKYAYYGSEDPSHAGLMKSKTDPRGASGTEAVSWGVLKDASQNYIQVSGDTLSVQLFAPADSTKQVVADAIRVDRLDPDGTLTRIADDVNSTGVTFRVAQPQNTSSGNVGGQQTYGGTSTSFSASNSNVATWIITGLLPGKYRVSATWTSAPSRDPNAKYQLFDGLPGASTAWTVYKDQTQSPIQSPNDFGSFQTVYTYDAAGNVMQVLTEGLPATVRAYDSFGNVLTATDPTGVQTVNHYDALGRLKDTSVSSTASPSVPAVGTTALTYDASGQLKTATDALGHVATNVYDHNGRLTSQSFADGTSVTYEYDEAGNRISSTDELGRKSRFVYDARNRVIQTIFADGTSARTRYDGAGRILASIDELGRETDSTYDKSGRLLTTKRDLIYDSPTPTTITLSNHYDSLGRLDYQLDANGNKTTYGYDKLNRVIETKVLNANASLSAKQHTATGYDANGNVSTTTAYDESNGGALPSEAVTTAYDAFGRPVTVTNADNKTTATIYDAAGRVRFTIDELGRKTEAKYDAYGRLERTISPTVSDSQGTAINPYTRYVRDAAGNIIEDRQYVSGSGATAVELVDKSSYDARNRLVTTIRPDGTRVDNVFDKAGQLVAAVDAMGNASYMDRDERGRVVLEHAVDPDGAAKSASVGRGFAPVTTHQYDAAGNVTSTTDPLGNTTNYAYDSLNRLRKESHNQTLIADDSNGGDSSFSAPGVLQYVANDATKSYDRDWTILHATAANASSPKTAIWTFSNLEPGVYRISISSVSVQGSASAAKVDILDTVSPLPSILMSQLSKFGDFHTVDGDREMGWSILKDANGNQQTVTAATGANTFRVQLSLNSTGDMLADAVRLDRVVSTMFDYDNNGNKKAETDTRGNVTNYDYDELNRQTSVKLPDPDGGGALGRLETQSKYDGYGNLIQTTELRDPNDSNDSRVTTYVYDQRNRLKTKTVNSTGLAAEKLTTTYLYDSAGNTTDVTDPVGAVTHYRYDNLNRVIDQYDDYTQGQTALPLTITTQLIQSDGSGRDGLIPPSSFAISSPGPTSDTIISLSGTAYKGLTWNYTVQANTVLDFDFSGKVGRFAMIGFDTDGTMNDATDASRFFELVGMSSLDWSQSGFNTEFYQASLPSVGTTHFHIPIGQYLTDAQKAAGLAITRLVLVNDEYRDNIETVDRGISTFSNIKLYESDEVRTVTKYDAVGNVATVQTKSDPRNIKTLYQYDKLGRQTDEYLDYVGPQQRHTHTSYDDNGNVLIERTPTPNSYLPTSTTTVDTAYEYDKLNRLTKTTLPDADGNSATPNGLFTTYGYDVAGRQISETNGEHETTYTDYDNRGNVVAETDGNGHQTRYQYDSAGNQTAVTDADQNTTTYTYDALGRETAETNFYGTRTTVYYATGNVKTITDRDSRLRQFFYDTLDRQIEERWQLSNTLVSALAWQYDKLGRVTYERSGTSGLTGNIATLAAALGIATPVVNTFVYDGLGRLIDQTNYDTAPGAALPTTGPAIDQKYTYSFNPAAAGSTTFNKRVVCDQYFVAPGTATLFATTEERSDRLGQFSYERDKAAGTAAFNPAITSKQTTFTYDTAGNLLETYRIGGPVTDYQYDQAGRLTTINHQGDEDPLASHSYAYDNASRVKTFATTGSGSVSRNYTYDDAGQLTDQTGGFDGAHYEYDNNGNRVIRGSYNYTSPSNTIGTGNRLMADDTFSYVYDPEGNVITRTVLVNGQPTGATTTYTWDYRNRLVSVTDPSAAATGYATFGEVKQIFVSQTDRNQWTHVALQGYTSPVVIAQLASSNESDPATVRVKNVTATGFDIQIEEWDYEGTGAHISEMVDYMVVEANAPGTFYQLAGGGKLVAGTTSKNANNTDTASVVPFTPGTFSTPPLVLAQVMSATGTETVTARVKDESTANFHVFLQPQKTYPIVTGDPATETIGYVAFQPFTSNSTPGTGAYEARSATAAGPDVLNNFNQTYSASPLPLIFATIDSYNGTRATTVRVTSETAQNVRLRAEIDLSDGSSQVHQNETAALVVFAQQGWLYDAARPFVPATRYTYDAEGRRVLRTTDPGVGGVQSVTNQSFVYDGDQLSMQFAGATGSASVLQHRYMDGPDGQTLVDEVFSAAGASTDKLWLLPDQQGTVRDIVDGNGVLRKHVDYDSVGNVTGQQFYDSSGTPTINLVGNTAAVDELFYYAGAERDVATGLDKDGARWYSPQTARFLSEDPSGFDGGDANLYRYVGNSYPNDTDPTGLSLVSPIAALTKSAGNAFLNTTGDYFGNLGNGFNNVASSFTGRNTNYDTPLLNPASSFVSTSQLQAFNLQPRYSTAPAPTESQILKNFINNPSHGVIDRATDYAATQRLEQDLIQQGTTGQTFMARLSQTLEGAGDTFYPGVAEYQNGSVLFGSNSSKTERAVAGVGLGLSLVTLGEGPSFGGSAERSVFKVETHTLEEVADAQRLTHEIQVHGQFEPHQVLQYDASAGALNAADRLAINKAVGQAGEVAAGVAGRKIGIVSPLSGRMRFPDFLSTTERVLKESKNVAYQALTSQIKDYIAIAKQKGLDFELHVRNDTTLSKPLKAARDAGDVIIKFFEGP